MKILYLAHRIPYPPDKGDKIRAYHQIRHLAQSHDLHLACLIDDEHDLRYVADLEKICASVDAVFRNRFVSQLRSLLALFGTSPLSVAAFLSRELHDRLARRLSSESFDLVYVYSSAMAQYVPMECALPKIMDFVDMDSEKWRVSAEHHGFPFSWIYRTEAARMARFETDVGRRFDLSVFVSKVEAELFRERCGIDCAETIPNGVDFDYFTPRRDRSPGDGPPTVVFTGVMDYFQNIDGVKQFCETTLHRIRRVMPQVQFCVVGRNPTRQVIDLSRQSGVVVTGSVRDVRPYLENAQVAVVPLRIARGIQNKILEAMSMELPVVCTPVASEGIGASAAEGLSVADGPQQFADKVLELLRDERLRRECGAGARRYVCEHHRWEDHGKYLDSLLDKAVRSRSPVHEVLHAPTA